MWCCSLRNLHLLHRWLGILFGLLILAWFLSGIVMLYVPYPSLTPVERLTNSSVIDLDQVKFSMAEIWSEQIETRPDTVKLIMQNNRPVYHLMQDKVWQSVWADDGQKVVVDEIMIRSSVNQFANSARVRDTRVIERDQWSVSSKYDGHRPLYVVTLDDVQHTELYVSSKTGEVVLDTTKSERAWNWVGSVVHWIYFTPLRTQGSLWRQVILWTAFFSFLLVLVGMFLGYDRLRINRRYKNGRISPYSGWKKWHHILGMVAGIFCLTWILSGWLSVKPFNWISDRKITQLERTIWAEKNQTVSDMLLPKHSDAIQTLKEMTWVSYAGNTYILARDEYQESLIDPHTGQVIEGFGPESIKAQVMKLQAGEDLQSYAVLENGDMYYRASGQKKLVPVLRAQFNDSEHTSYYIDPRTSNIVAAHDHNSRLYRWLFHGLHCLDIPLISDTEFRRKLNIIVLSVLGILLSLAGIVIGMKRLRYKLT